MRHGGALLVLLCGAPSLGAAGAEGVDAPAPEPPAWEGEPRTGWDLRGSLSLRYRLRRSHGEEDQDLYQRASFSGERLERGVTRLEWSFDGLLWEDLDRFEGTGGTTGSNIIPFTDPSNTFGDRVHALLYEGYVQANDDGPLRMARIGRQSLYREEGILFDGLRLAGPSTGPVVLEAYGGLPTHLYESSPSGDAIAGVGARARPLPPLRLGLDWIYIRDRIRDANDPTDRLLVGTVAYRPLPNLRAEARASFVDGRDRRQQLLLRYRLPSSGLEVRGRIVRQNSFVTFYTNELSPYVAVEGRYAPHLQWDLDVAQPFAEYFEAGGGVRMRELLRSRWEGIFNRGFRNGYLWLACGEIVPGLRVEARVDLWGAEDATIVSEGVSVRQDIGRMARVELGSDFALYRFDAGTGTERERDRLYYGGLEWFFGERLGVRVRYEYERDTEREYHGIDTGVTLRF